MKSLCLFFLVVAVIIAVNFSEESSSCEKSNDPIISAAMIADRRHSKDTNSLRAQEFVYNFTRSVFSTSPEVKDVRYWPPILSRSCDMNGPEAFDKGRGSNLAHKEIWDNFYRSRRKCGNQDVLIIFEYDAFLGFPNAGKLAVQYAKNLTTDFIFLGYCYHKPQHHPRLGGKAPYCLHAYAISVEGARKLSLLVDACGPFADAQVANLADAGLLTWSYVNHSVDHSYVNEQFLSRGVHISGKFEYDGIFLQVKLDQILSIFSEGTVVHNQMRPKKIYVLINNLWRRLPSMDMFYSLGLQQEKILTLSNWQFRQYEEGEVMSEGNKTEIIENRNTSISKKERMGIRNRTRMGIEYRNRSRVGFVENKNRRVMI